MIKPNIDRINEFLEFRRWRKTDLATAMRLSESYITRIFNGEREPSRFFMDRLSCITGLSLGELFFSSNSPQNGIDEKCYSQKCPKSDERTPGTHIGADTPKSHAVDPKTA